MTKSPFATAEEAKAALDYPAYREWWSEFVVKKPYAKRRVLERVKPPPGVIDLADNEAG